MCGDYIGRRQLKTIKLFRNQWTRGLTHTHTERETVGEKERTAAAAAVFASFFFDVVGFFETNAKLHSDSAQSGAANTHIRLA